jgi:hypothetical protein
VGSTSSEFGFAVWQYTPYRHGQPCDLGIRGTTEPFQIFWSPVQDPLDARTVELTVTASNIVDGDGTLTVTAERGAVGYGQTGWLFAFTDEYTNGTPVILLAPTTVQYVDLVEPLVDPEFGVSAIPELAGGDQLIWWNALPSGEVTVFSDRSFIADGTVNTFDVEAYESGVGYTNTETQDINFGPDPNITASITDLLEQPAGTITYQASGFQLSADLTDLLESVSGTAVSGANFSEWVSPVPITNCANQPLANQFGIEYAVLPGHTPHATTAIKTGSDGTTDANGYFRLQNLLYAPAQPVTLIMRWMEDTRDRYVVLYTQLTQQ